MASEVATAAKQGEVVRMGRPSKLTQDMIAAAWAYVDTSDNMSPETAMPTVERLALTLEVHRDTLYDWAEKNKDFSDILMRLGQIQADKLLQNGLIGKYNPVITKLMLSKHGYIEKTEVDQKIDMVTPILGAASKQITDESTPEQV